MTRAIAALAAAALLPGVTAACTTADPSRGAVGIIIPDNLTSIEDLAATLDSHQGLVRIDIKEAAVGPNGQSTGTPRTVGHSVSYPNGDFSSESADGEKTLIVGAATYTYTTVFGGDSSRWYRTDNADHPTLAGLLIPFDDYQDGALTSTDNGYLVDFGDSRTASGTRSGALTLDMSRQLTEARWYVDRSVYILTLTYLTDAPKLEAPADAEDLEQEPLEDRAAQQTLRAAADAVRALTATMALGSITDEDLRAELGDGTFSLGGPGLSYDPSSIGFANDGATVELVVSDGNGSCYRSRITERAEDVTSDETGIPNDLGMVCSTEIDAG